VSIEETGRKAYCFGARLHEPGAGVKLFDQAVEKLGGVVSSISPLLVERGLIRATVSTAA
jgi:hypothetical protein